MKTMFPPQGIAALLEEALVVYKGTTDSAGAADGSTLKCSALASLADFNGNQVIITSGNYKGQARDINGVTTAGTITPANAFSGQIASGVTFVVTGIRTVPAEVAELEVDVMSLIANGQMPASVLYVKTDGDDTNDGTTWAKAVKTIDHAVGLCTATKGDVIFVLQGTYDEKAHGTAGVTCDVDGITIIGVGDVLVKNTNTTNSGSCFTITADSVRLINLEVQKGETTSANAILISIDGSNYTKLKGVKVSVDDDATFTGIKITNTCGSIDIGSFVGGVRTEITSLYDKGTGINYDGSGMIMIDTLILGFTTGLSIGANGKWLGIAREASIERCTTGILIAAGATNNVLNMAMSTNTTNITDNSGNATNDYHSSVVYIYDQLRHIEKQSGITYFVDGTNGLDTNAGTSPEEAFATIGAAIAAASSGDHIVVMRMAAKYDEAGLTIATAGIELIFEQGAILEDTGGGDVLTVTEQDCKLDNVNIDNDDNGGKCFVINAQSCTAINCVALQGTVGFDIDGNKGVFNDCVAIDNSVSQFDIKSKYGIFQYCFANGDGQAVRGFYLSNNSADLNTFISCHSIGNTTAGWEVVLGANENLFSSCSSGANDGARVDSGTNNSWANFAEGSQIVAGQSRDQDLKDIYDEVAGLDGDAMRGTDNAALAATALTNATWTDALAGYIANINNVNLATIPDISGINTTDDTQIKFAAAGSKTIASGATKYLSIDSGTNGAEIISITVKGVVAADWTIETYIPVDDAVAAPAAGDKRDEDTYLNGEDKGGQLTNIGAIRYNMFMDVTNDSGGSDNIDEVIICYRSQGTLSLAWEA